MNDPTAPKVLPPHPVLGEYYGDEAERQRFIRKIFDETAGDYDRIERMMAQGSGPWYRRQALMRAGLGAGERVLDVGIGTGLVAREALGLIGPTGKLVGVDPSPGMMGEVKLPGVELVQGRAESIPQPDGAYDFLSMGYALRHISDVNAAFSEFHRVLRPGGRVLVLEISKPKGSMGTAFLKFYMKGIVPLIARFVSRQRDTAHLWRYYWDTIEAVVPPAQVMATLSANGLIDVEREVTLGIFSEYRARG